MAHAQKVLVILLLLAGLFAPQTGRAQETLALVSRMELDSLQYFVEVTKKPMNAMQKCLARNEHIRYLHKEVKKQILRDLQEYGNFGYFIQELTILYMTPKMIEDYISSLTVYKNRSKLAVTIFIDVDGIQQIYNVIQLE